MLGVMYLIESCSVGKLIQIRKMAGLHPFINNAMLA